MKSILSVVSRCCLTLIFATLLCGNASAQILTTDRTDYSPGSVCALTGSGFAANETVTLQIVHADDPSQNIDEPAHQPWSVTADANGIFQAYWLVNTDSDQVGASLLATANGVSSGSHAEVVFTDGPNGNGTGIVSSVVSANGSCVTYSDGNQVDNWNVLDGGSYTVTLTNVTECSEGAITVFVQSSLGLSGNYCFNAYRQGNTNTFVGSILMPTGNCYTNPISYKCGGDIECNNLGAYNAQGPSGAPSVHFNTSYFDHNCNVTGQDNTCVGLPPSCSDGIQNQGETGVDVGGPCSPECTHDFASISASSTQLCPGPVTLTASGGVSYAWSTGSHATSISVSAIGTYYVTAYNADGCDATTSIQITDCSQPTCTTTVSIISVDPDATVCVGECTTFSADVIGGIDPLSYVWSPNGETTSSIQACEVGDYSVHVICGNGCSANAQFHLYNYTLTPVSLDPASGCAGSNISLNGKGSPAGGSYSASNPYNNSVAGVYPYTYSIIDANGCPGSASSDITVYTLPGVSLDPASGCAGSNISLDGKGSPAGGTYSVSNPYSNAVAGVYPYSYSVTDNHSCSNSASSNITVNPNPNVQVSADGGLNRCFVPGDCVTLTASGADSYVWSDGSTDAFVEFCSTGNYSFSVTGTTSATTCHSSYGPVSGTVYPEPTCNLDPIAEADLPTSNTNNNSICANGLSAGTYTWTLTSSDGSWTFAAGTNHSACLTYHCGTFGSSATFTITVTDSHGCSHSCSVSISPEAHEQCAYTQGFYGNTGGLTTCIGMNKNQALTQALHTSNTGVYNSSVCVPICVGSGTRKFTVGCNDIQCVIDKLN
jgi:VCBS repeat-containing protein